MNLNVNSLGTYLDRRSIVNIARGILTSLYSLRIAFTIIDATFSGGNRSSKNGNLKNEHHVYTYYNRYKKKLFLITIVLIEQSIVKVKWIPEFIFWDN